MDTRLTRRQTALVTGLAATSLLSVLTTPPAWAVDDRRDLMDFDASKFSRPNAVTNKWMPLMPGRQLVYEGSTVDEGRRIPHRIVSTVTDLIKEINGVSVTVLLEKDFSRGKLEEQELMFLAQDDAGNVWHLGQIRETYDEDDEFVGTRAWMVGHLEGARAGIMMTANPTEGLPSYSQGFAPPPFNWTDRARVKTLNERITVPAGTYAPVLVVEEFDQEHPNAVQLKYYAEGIGNIKISFTGNDPKQEIVDLVRVVDLNAEQMVQVRADAAALEARAYVYATTKPATRRPQ